MHPKADMVPEECGFNRSETASCLCAHVAWRFPGSPGMGRDGELIQTQYFCHHADTICHPNSSYVTTKLYERWNVDVTIIRSFRTSYVHVSYHRRSLAARKPWWRCESRNMARLMNSSFFMFKTSLLPNYRVKYDYNCKVVQWYSMRLVCIAGYFLTCSFKFALSRRR